MEEMIFWFVKKHHSETLNLLKEFAAIPAPSGQEEKRAQFVMEWLQKQGASGVYKDAAGNVVFPYQCEGDGPIAVIMAHLDVVCPDTTPLAITEEEDRLTGPGVRDDTANLVNMLMCVKFLLECQQQVKCGLLFVADTGEEGLGNLKGSRQIWEDYHDRIREWIAFDLNYDTIYNRAVGSQRYRVTVRTTGGHSYKDFGGANAIVQLAGVLLDLCRAEIPQSPKVTFNVGEISGGTSINTIAQEASMLYEFRSESAQELKKMEQFFETVLEKHRADGTLVEVEELGIRPGNGKVDETAQKNLEQRCLQAIRRYYKGDVYFESGSTDCNIPLSNGVAAVAIGTALGGGTHTRQEWVEKKSMETGQMIALKLVCSYRV